jgi:hypothetical protein
MLVGVLDEVGEDSFQPPFVAHHDQRFCGGRHGGGRTPGAGVGRLPDQIADVDLLELRRSSTVVAGDVDQVHDQAAEPLRLTDQHKVSGSKAARRAGEGSSTPGLEARVRLT